MCWWLAGLPSLGTAEEYLVRILLVGAGGVGRAFAGIAARRGFFEAVVVADYDFVRAEGAAARLND